MLQNISQKDFITSSKSSQEKSKKYVTKIGKRKRFTWLERQIELTKSQVDIKKMKGFRKRQKILPKP